MIYTVSGDAMKEIIIKIETEAVGKGRPRFSRYGSTYTPVKTKNFEKLIANEYIKQSNNYIFDKVPIKVSVIIEKNIPKSATKKHRAELLSQKWNITKPDIDNCLKSILDALNGIAYQDDNQVSSITACKINSTRNFITIKMAELSS